MRIRRLLPVLVLIQTFAAPSFAQRLPTGVRPDHYDLAFDVDLAGARFGGTETIRVRLDRPSRRIVLHAADIQFHEVTIRHGASTQNATVALDRSTETAALAVPRAIPAGAADIRIRYTGILNDQLRGFYSSKANGRRYAVTQLEAADARRAFPSFDEPALKATFAITLTIDSADTAISNGRLLQDRPGPGEARHTLTFATTPRMSTYLVAMAVGDFKCLEGSADQVPVRVCATPDKKDLGHLALRTTGEILTVFNRYYDIKYPFGKLDMVAIPDFAAGAMENTAAIFYRETALLADETTASLATRKNIATVIAHEVAHQWFGNLVTMRWWDDLWLNEGFATWMETRPLAAAYPEWNIDVDEALSTETALGLDALRSTRPIKSNAETPAQIEETFDVIAYQKGGAVLRMIEGYVGAEDFRKGINAYLAKHAYANATSEDFWRAVTSASGKPVDRILATFVNQPGVPLVDVSLTCDAGGSTLRVTQQRFVLDPASQTPTPGHWQIPVCHKDPTSEGVACTVMNGAALVSRTALATCPKWVFVNAGARGYYRTAYPPDMLRAFAADLATKLSAPERLSLAGNEWALVMAGRHTVADYLTLATGFGAERTSGVLAEVTTRLAFIHDYLVGDQERPRFEAFVRSLLRTLFNEVGLTPRGSEPDDRRALRTVLIEALGRVGNDPDVIAAARGLVERALTGDAVLEPTMAATVLHVAARGGDRALFDALLAAAKSARTPEEHYRYINTLAHFENPELVQRALERTLSDETRSQDLGGYLRGFLVNPSPSVKTRAWAFMKEHWAELLPKLTISFTDSRVIGDLGSFCDGQTRDDIQAFFAANPRPSAARSLQQAVERINACMRLKEKQGPALARWLSNSELGIQN